MREAEKQIRFRKTVAIVELTVALTFILLQIWEFQGRNRWGAYLAAALILASWIIRKESLNNLGLIGKRYALPIAVILVAKLMFGHHSFFDVHGTPAEQTALRISMYFVWATVQQLTLNGFFVGRLVGLIKEDYIPVWAGLIFGIVHIPNLVLIPVTIVGGGLASYGFLKMKKKNLYWIALAHTIIGMLIFYYVPQSLHHNMVVGPKFYASR